MTNTKSLGNPAGPFVEPDRPANAPSRPRGKPRARLNKDEKAASYERQLETQLEAARKAAARKRGAGLVRLSAWVPLEIKGAVTEFINEAVRLHAAARAVATPRPALSPFSQRLRDATVALKTQFEMSAGSSDVSGEASHRTDTRTADEFVGEVDGIHEPDVFDEEEMLATFEIGDLSTNEG